MSPTGQNYTLFFFIFYTAKHLLLTIHLFNSSSLYNTPFPYIIKIIVKFCSLIPETIENTSFICLTSVSSENLKQQKNLVSLFAGKYQVPGWLKQLQTSRLSLWSWMSFSKTATITNTSLDVNPQYFYENFHSILLDKLDTSNISREDNVGNFGSM